MMKLLLCLLFPPFWPVAIWHWLFAEKPKKKLLISSLQVECTRQQLLFDKSFAEKHLTKSLVGSVIQNAVFLKEVSAKDALEWLVKTDKVGLLEGYRSLPAELQNRLAEKICENLAE